MAEEGKGTPKTPEEGNGTPKEPENMVPSYRLKEEADKRRELENRLADIERQEKERKSKELEQQGKFQELLKEREAELEAIKAEKEKYKTTADKWNSYEEEKKNTLLEKIPEQRRDKFAGLGLQELEAIVEMVSLEKPSDPKHPSGIGKAGGGPFDGYDSLPEFAEAMRQKGTEGTKRYKEVINSLRAKHDTGSKSW